MTVEIILTISLAAGAITVYTPELSRVLSYMRQKIIIPAGGEKGAEIMYGENPSGVNDSIRRLIHISLGINIRGAAAAFWFMSALLAAAVCLLTAGRVPAAMTMLLSLFAAALPAAALLGKLQTLRIGSSKEGEVLLVELLDNYKINYFNMREAVEVTAVTIEEAPNCKRLLFNLSKGLNRTSGGRELRELLDDFKFAVGTSWAGILTDNIYFSLTSGIRVTEAMEDLIKTVSKAKEVEEISGRENNEAKLILKYLAPACYLLTVFGGIKYFGLSAAEFLHYQFGTEAGIIWFSAAAVSYISAVSAMRFMGRKKLDL